MGGFLVGVVTGPGPGVSVLPVLPVVSTYNPVGLDFSVSVSARGWGKGRVCVLVGAVPGPGSRSRFRGPGLRGFGSFRAVPVGLRRDITNVYLCPSAICFVRLEQTENYFASLGFVSIWDSTDVLPC